MSFTPKPNNSALPLNVISGFLGSGKTTLLNRLLDHPQLANTLVLINEFGEVGLDHLIVGRLDETTVLLRSGCVCCTLREDLLSSLTSIAEMRAAGTLTHVDRVVLETTGLVDPAPIAATMGHHSPLCGLFYYDSMLVTVDAMNWRVSVQEHREARAQISLADSLCVTKLDLVPDEREPAVEMIRKLNPKARVFSADDQVDPLELLGAGLVDPTAGEPDTLHGTATTLKPGETQPQHEHDHEHSEVRSFGIKIEGEVDLQRFALQTSLLTQFNPDRVLRMKALLCVPGEPGYLSFNAIRSYVHTPTVVPAPPGAARRSSVVFIVQDFSDKEVAMARRAIMSSAVQVDDDSLQRSSVS